MSDPKVEQKIDNTEIILDEGGIRVLGPKIDNYADWLTATNPDKNAVDLHLLELRKQNVPDASLREESYNLDRSTLPPSKSPYQAAARAERLGLSKGIVRFFTSLPQEAQTALESAETAQTMINFLPNTKIGYFNKLIKKALDAFRKNNKKIITEADIDYISNVWINPESQKVLLKFLNVFKGNEDGYSIQPPPSKGPITYRDYPGLTTGKYIPLKNPGDVYMPYEPEDRSSNTESDASDLAMKMLKALDMKLLQLKDQMSVIQDIDPLLALDSANNELKQTLVWAQDKLLDKHMRYADIIKLSESLHRLVGLKRSKYFLSLSNPFKHRTARIPTLISPPSATFSIRSIIPLTTNALGNVAFAINPFYLSDSALAGTSAFVNNNAALTGLAASNFFTGIAIGQQLPANFYVRHRLVSAGLRIHCYPSSNNDNGILAVAVSFESLSSQLVGAVSAEAAQWGDFNQVENGYWKKTTTIASREVQEHVYLPIDESMYDYQTVPGGYSGFSFIGYISGAAPSVTIARIEVCLNFEALLDNQYTDYLPSGTVDDDEVEPRNIPGVINYVRKNVETLTPKEVEQALRDKQVVLQPDTNITLPPSKKEIQQTTQEFEKTAELMKSITKDALAALTNQKKPSFVNRVLDVLSPVATGVLSSLFNRIMPFAFPFKF